MRATNEPAETCDERAAETAFSRLLRHGAIAAKGRGRTTLVACVVAATLTGAVLLAAVLADGSETDGGPVDAGGFRGGASFSVHVGRPITFANVMLVNRGSERAVLEDIELINPTGGIRKVGALVGIAHRPQDIVAGDADFPPDLGRMVLAEGALGRLQPLERFVIEHTGWRGPPFAGAVLLVLGIEVTKTGEHSYRGLKLRYRVADRTYSRTIPYALAACAPYRYYDEHSQECEIPSPTGS